MRFSKNAQSTFEKSQQSQRSFLRHSTEPFNFSKIPKWEPTEIVSGQSTMRSKKDGWAVGSPKSQLNRVRGSVTLDHSPTETNLQLIEADYRQTTMERYQQILNITRNQHTNLQQRNEFLRVQNEKRNRKIYVLEREADNLAKMIEQIRCKSMGQNHHEVEIKIKDISKVNRETLSPKDRREHKQNKTALKMKRQPNVYEQTLDILSSDGEDTRNEYYDELKLLNRSLNLLMNEFGIETNPEKKKKLKHRVNQITQRIKSIKDSSINHIGIYDH